MSLKWAVAPKRRALALLAPLLVGGVAITWFDLRNGPSPQLTFLSIGYAVVACLCVAGMVRKKSLTLQPSDVWRRTNDLTKSAIMILSGVLWGTVALKLVPDTYVGVAIILVPFGALTLVGAYFFIKSLWMPLK
jgi:hypothetical protein